MADFVRSCADAPVWLVVALIALALLILVGPRRSHDRCVTLIRAWRGTEIPRTRGGEPVLEPTQAPASSNAANADPPSVLLLVFLAVVVACIPTQWRSRFRDDFHAELVEIQPTSRRVPYVVRVLVRVPALRRVLVAADKKPMRAKR